MRLKQVLTIYIVLVLISRLFYFLSSLRRGDQSTVFCTVLKACILNDLYQQSQSSKPWSLLKEKVLPFMAFF